MLNFYPSTDISTHPQWALVRSTHSNYGWTGPAKSYVTQRKFCTGRFLYDNILLCSKIKSFKPVLIFSFQFDNNLIEVYLYCKYLASLLVK